MAASWRPEAASAPSARDARAQQILEALVVDRELHRVDHELLVRLAVDAEQADRRGDGGLPHARRGLLQGLQRFERALVAQLAHRQDGVFLQRPVALRDFGDRRERVGRVIVAERFDDRAAIEVLAAQDERGQRGLDRGIVAVGGQRAGQRRTDELPVLLVELLEQARRHPALGVVLEVGVGDGAQPIVRLVERGGHDFPRPRDR